MFEKNQLIAASTLLLGTLATHCAMALTPLSDPNNEGNWVINSQMTDEFNGTSFDRSVWYNLGENGNYRGEWKGRAPSQYNPDNISVRNGFLYLKSRWQPDFNFADEVPSGNPTSAIRYGQVAPITSAALRSINTFKYGYMEMRAQAANGPISSSYWTTGGGGETDAFENFGYNPNNKWSGKRVHTSFHDWRTGSPTRGKRIWDNAHILETGVAESFHTYGFEWDANYIAIYVDGGLVKCTTRAEMGDKWVATNPHKVWIDSEVFDWEVKPADLRQSHFGNNGIDFIVDYARVFQRQNGAVGPGCPNRTNLVQNPGFENGKTSWTGDGSVNNESYSGSKGLTLTGAGTTEQIINVKPNTTYVLSGYVTSPDTNESNIWRNAYLGVKNYGGSVNDARFFFPRWGHKSVQFTTGPNNTKATIYFTNAPQGGLARLDDVLVTELIPSSANTQPPVTQPPVTQPPTTQPTTGVTPPSGNTSLQVRQGGKCFELPAGNAANGTSIVQWGCSQWSTNQDYKFEAKGQGYYQIKTKHNKCVSVAGGSTANGANVTQWDCYNSDNFLFKLVDKGNNWFELRPKHSNKCLEIANGSTDNGGNVHQWACTAANNQQFKFIN